MAWLSSWHEFQFMFRLWYSHKYKKNTSLSSILFSSKVEKWRRKKREKQMHIQKKKNISKMKVRQLYKIVADIYFKILSEYIFELALLFQLCRKKGLVPDYTCIWIQFKVSKTRIQKSKPSVTTDSLSMYGGRYLSDNSFVYIMVSHQIVWYLINYYVTFCIMLLISGMCRKHLKCFRMWSMMCVFPLQRTCFLY